ncbi:RNA methyltransferase [Marivivens niveibacter]|uniref:RNA methyltransferase n=1 Tax=Marivivens niveibacter TaxID=1930667 RepID=A0A251X2X1_9RHOB|nr:RNA methyltransferase [Marivivens niveibacter]OUD11027.1 RNA methyltransferase [Marivivens niveibacter]
MSDLELFLSVAPGFENALAAEAARAGFSVQGTSTGGVTVNGDWPDVWRANLVLRGAARVLVRIGSFRVMHLAQLDKRARKFPWGDTLRKDVPIKVDVTCRKSKIYHAKAAKQRIETALTESFGATLSDKADITLKVRIEDDLCTISLDSSGESLHKRGHKSFVGKAPMRENMAALFLEQMGYDGTQSIVDPMCGSGTFAIEAAQIAANLWPGRDRSFAFEKFASFDQAAFDKIRSGATNGTPTQVFYGSDRDAGAIKGARENAARAGVDDWVTFEHHAVSDLPRPDGAPGIVIVNPPYGARIGNKKLLYAVYGALGKTLLDRFSGWRVGIITSEPALAKTTGLPFEPENPPISHGGLRIQLWQTGPLP